MLSKDYHHVLKVSIRQEVDENGKETPNKKNKKVQTDGSLCYFENELSVYS